MRPIYILIITLLLSTASSYAQLEGLLGDIMEEVQEKVGDAQQDAAETASMKEFKNEIKDILVGINGLDKYSSELKCIYIILKLAMLDQDLEAKIQNAGNCKKKYDLYGMQLMVKASYTGIGYCFDPLTELITQRDPNASDDSILLTPELEEFFETKQKLSAQHLATEFGFFYSKVVNQQELEASLQDFYEDSLHPKILEIETSSQENAKILKSVKETIKLSLEN